MHPLLSALSPLRFVLIGCLGLLLALTAQAQAIPAAERQTLLELFNATDGPNWTNKTGWGGPVGSECSWYGVRCDSTPRVVEIRLSSNNLRGRLPALSALSALQVFHVADNQLSGPLPEPPAGLQAAMPPGMPPGHALNGAAIGRLAKELRPLMPSALLSAPQGQAQ